MRREKHIQPPAQPDGRRSRTQQKGLSLVTISSPKFFAFLQTRLNTSSSVIRYAEENEEEEELFTPVKPSQPRLHSLARRRCGHSSYGSRSKLSNCFLRRRPKSAYSSSRTFNNKRKIDKVCHTGRRKVAQHHGSRAHGSRASAVVQPNTHAHWHLRCNPLKTVGSPKAHSA